MSRTHISALLLGTAAGTAAALATSFLGPARTPPEGSIAPITGVPSATHGLSPVVQLGSLEARLAALEGHASAEPDNQPKPERTSHSQANAHNLDDETRQLRAWYVAHDVQPRNAAWATEASSRLQRDLGGIADEQLFTILDIDCRSSSCGVELEWDDFEQAIASQGALLHRRYELNCERTVPMIPPDSSLIDAPYRTRILFNCASAPDLGRSD
jgi:hypothetical protein